MTENEMREARPAVAQQIKNYFYQQKSEQQGKRYSPHERYRKKEIWDTAAELCIQAGADPYSFVRAAFLQNSIPGGPFPHTMASKASVRWYEEYRRVHGVDDHSKQDVFANEIKAMLTAAQCLAMQQTAFLTPEDFFLDDSFTPLDSMPAFVRVVLMPTSEKVFRKYGKLAYQQVMGNPRLMDVLYDLKMDLRFVDRIKRG